MSSPIFVSAHPGPVFVLPTGLLVSPGKTPEP